MTTTDTLQIRPSEDAAAGAAALDKLLSKALPDRHQDEYDDARLTALWRNVTDGDWHLLGAAEAAGGFGLGLRDLVEVARIVGRHAAPLPITTTIVHHALGGHAPDVSPHAATVCSRRAGGRTRVVHGGFPGAGEHEPSVDPFAPTLHVVTLEAGVDACPQPADVRRWLTVLWTAEAIGAAGLLLDTAAEYARVREQFGKPIGSFQAIKHELADAVLFLQEATTAVVWAANEHPAPAAGVRLALDRCISVSETAAQVHGGIGMTWELGQHFWTRHIIALRDLVEDLLAQEGQRA